MRASIIPSFNRIHVKAASLELTSAVGSRGTVGVDESYAPIAVAKLIRVGWIGAQGLKKNGRKPLYVEAVQKC